MARAHATTHGATSFEVAKPKKKTASFSRAIVQANDTNSAVPVGIITFAGDNEDFATQEFIKDVICEGNFAHPKKDWELPVTIERMDRWVDNFNKMQQNGVEVPVVKDHQVTADTTLGYVRSLFRIGDKLRCRFEARGDASIDTVQRVNHVSIGLRDKFKDGKRNEYGEAIEHIGMTPIPIVPGQGDIVRIAASRGQSSQEIPVFYRLATEDGSMNWKELQKILGLDTELTEENALEYIQNKIAEGTVAMDKSKELVTKMATLEKELAALKEKQGKKEEEEPTLSDNEAEDAAEAIADEVASVTASLGMKPADTEELTALLTGSPNDRNVHLLSRMSEPNAEGRRPIRAKVITNFLRKIDPDKLVKTGGKTGIQTFSRRDATQEPDPDETEKEIKARADQAYA